jgi:hypothetical protein
VITDLLGLLLSFPLDLISNLLRSLRRRTSATKHLP